jgi:PPOX class probable F420-dependent enzyme
VQDNEAVQPTDDVRAFLAERRYATLATVDVDGVIHLTPVWFLFDGGRFLFASFSGSRKVRNVERSAVASVIVDAREPGGDRWVAASGTFAIVGGEEAQAINAEIRRRYLTAEALADERIEPAFAASDDLTLTLTPVRWRTWSGKEFDEQKLDGILGATPERWFLPLAP